MAEEGGRRVLKEEGGINGSRIWYLTTKISSHLI